MIKLSQPHTNIYFGLCLHNLAPCFLVSMSFLSWTFNHIKTLLNAPWFGITEAAMIFRFTSQLVTRIAHNFRCKQHLPRLAAPLLHYGCGRDGWRNGIISFFGPTISKLYHPPSLFCSSERVISPPLFVAFGEMRLKFVELLGDFRVEVHHRSFIR